MNHSSTSRELLNNLNDRRDCHEVNSNLQESINNSMNCQARQSENSEKRPNTRKTAIHSPISTSIHADPEAKF